MGGPQGLHGWEDLQASCIIVFFFASGFKFKIGLLVLVFPLVASVMVPGWMPLVALSWLLNALGCNSQLAAGSPGLLGTSSMSSIDEFTRKGG